MDMAGKKVTIIGAKRSGIIGLALGGPQRAVIGAAAGAVGNVAAGKVKDDYQNSKSNNRSTINSGDKNSQQGSHQGEGADTDDDDF